MNSVLEDQRKLVVIEEGSQAMGENEISRKRGCAVEIEQFLHEAGGNMKKELDVETVEANDGFAFLATMNPGGDHGKKELSPALRNRFTEIWVTETDFESESIASFLDFQIPNRDNKKRLDVCKFVISVVVQYNGLVHFPLTLRDVVRKPMVLLEEVLQQLISSGETDF